MQLEDYKIDNIYLVCLPILFCLASVISAASPGLLQLKLLNTFQGKLVLQNAIPYRIDIYLRLHNIKPNYFLKVFKSCF